VEDLPHGASRLRNHVIGRVFQALGLIKQWGSGNQRMTDVCRDASLREGQGLAAREIAAIIGLVR
jgi:ATP-dependent DNA helicase RecG